MANDPDAIDWLAWSKTRFSVTVDDLSHYNLAQVDPYTVRIAQTLCEQFKISKEGQRHLAHAFGSLPEYRYHSALGMGYGPRHLVRTLLKSDPGFIFLSVCGVLCEYFSEDVVVGVFMELMKQSRIPPDMAPADFQWKRLVEVCYGVLATSPFGAIVNGFTEHGKAGAHVDGQSVAQSLKTMNSLAIGREKSASISAGADVPWFAAVAQWLFDLKFVISGQDSQQLFISPGIREADEAQLVFHVDRPSTNTSQETAPSSTPTVTGGRVVWETLFRSCFGSAFQHLDKDILACTVANTSAMIHGTIVGAQHADSRIFFLQQTSAVPGLGGHGLNETIMAWFPELRRLSSHIEKWAWLPWEEAKNKFDENMKILESTCTCSACGSASATPAEMCKLSMVEVIVSLGLFIARMIVVPQLYPKRSGVLSFYQRHHARRLAHKPERAPRASDDFLRTFAAALPTPLQMIHTACILFSGSAPFDQSESPACVTVTHAGLCMAMTALKALTDDPNISPKASILVTTGNYQYHGRLIPLGVADEGIIGLSYSELFELVRTKPNAVRQIAKLRGETLLLSLIMLNQGQEAEAEAKGWLMV
jgi:hypothetical protein